MSPNSYYITNTTQTVGFLLFLLLILYHLVSFILNNELITLIRDPDALKTHKIPFVSTKKSFKKSLLPLRPKN